MEPARVQVHQPAIDDADLAERARHDPRAFEELYVTYLDPVYRYCYRRLGNPEQAEDATSQVFLKAYAAIANHRAGKFRGWLFTIAHNVVIDTYRRQRPVRPLDSIADPPDSKASPEELAIASDEGRQLRAMLAELTEDQRNVVELRLAGLTGVEIAEVLGRSHGSVKTIQFRAVARLRSIAQASTEHLEGSND